MKRILLSVLILFLVASAAFSVPPDKPTTLADGDRLTATWLNGMVNVVYTWCQNHGIASGATHGISGTFVGTTDTQTLTNKVLTTPTLTSPTINAATMSGTISCSGTVTLSGSITRSGTTTGGTIDGGTVSGTTTNSGTISGGTVSPTTLSPTSITTGNLTGNISANAGVTVDGVDIGAHAADTTTAHGVTGAVCGTTNSQTLTNKTLTSPQINSATASGTTLTNTTTNSGTISGGTYTSSTLTSPTINDGTTNLDGGTLITPYTTTPAQTAEGSVVWDSDSDLLTMGTGAARKTMTDTDSSQTLTNKTLTSPTINDGTVNLDGGTLVVPFTNTPAQTAEGSVVWDSDSDLLTIGTGAARKTMTDTDSSQTLTNKTITGTFTGNVTGNVTGSSGSCTGNAANVTGTVADANIASTICRDSELSSHDSDTTVHGATGAVVGTTNSQTLSNKTLDSSVLFYAPLAGKSWDGVNNGSTVNVKSVGVNQSPSFVGYYYVDGSTDAYYQGGTSTSVYFWYKPSDGYIKCSNSSGAKVWARVVVFPHE